jgi:hypothetical protein
VRRRFTLQGRFRTDIGLCTVVVSDVYDVDESTDRNERVALLVNAFTLRQKRSGVTILGAPDIDSFEDEPA